MFLIFAFGVVGLNSLRATFFPEMTTRLISIQVVSAGLSPLEVEESITKKIDVDSITDVMNFTNEINYKGAQKFLALFCTKALNQVMFIYFTRYL